MYYSNICSLVQVQPYLLHPRGIVRCYELIPHSSWFEGGCMYTILLIILILLLIGALPTWPYSTGWGYYPSGGLGLVVLILIILLLMGRL
jgi:hypothetical protein